MFLHRFLKFARVEILIGSRKKYIVYNEKLITKKGNSMYYDQKSLEAGLNAGIAVGVFLSIATASTIYIAVKTVKGVKELIDEIKTNS